MEEWSRRLQERREPSGYDAVPLIERTRTLRASAGFCIRSHPWPDGRALLREPGAGWQGRERKPFQRFKERQKRLFLNYANGMRRARLVFGRTGSGRETDRRGERGPSALRLKTPPPANERQAFSARCFPLTLIAPVLKAFQPVVTEG